MAQRTTKTQVNGYRFLFRRLEHALVRRDVRMIHDPMGGHIRSVMVGLVITVLVVGASVALAVFRPQGSVGDSKILLDRDSGALYTIINDTLHPALNLASARLATGSPEDPNAVKESVLSGYKRGPAIGIPGAPSSLNIHKDATSTWTACDQADEPANPESSLQVGVIGGPLDSGAHLSALGPTQALLAENGGKKYLVTAGHVAEVDMYSFAIRQALGLQNANPRPISAAVLNAMATAPDIDAPQIPDRGKPAPWDLSGARIGSVIQVDGTSESTLYVVLDDGIQQISEVAGDVILNGGDKNTTESVVKVAPGAIADIRQVSDLDLSAIPATRPTIVDGTSQHVLCFSWSKKGDDKASVATLIGDRYPLSSSATMVNVVGATGNGTAADVTYIPGGAGYFVRATGSEPDSTRADGQFYVADTGTRFGVPGELTKPLGFTDAPKSAPYGVISLLPAGPTLSRDAALVAHTDLEGTAGEAIPGDQDSGASASDGN
ncbi:type VII secretion protein EccB [Gordonia jinhuaensis]|uniref:Type VII secretion protein EccB n=1 Tax=Gordonia jinhuaensis TaxID=1517702 RepID=A0A916T566_9ACTN|nr:type VII secretion protein EccB [Gordonia jinhuaensis]GGB32153.1 hypothetical protein GCM10011489_20450 [Gordonia jinhuaensis]